MHEHLLLLAALADALVCDECVRNLGECGLNRSLVLHQGMIAAGPRKVDAGFDPSGVENRLGKLRHETPGAVRAAEQTRQLCTRATQQPAQRKSREISC